MTTSLATRNDIAALAGALTGLLADHLALYLKTKSCHWHVSGPHFAALHRLFDQQADAILAATDDLAERARRLGRRSLGSLAEAQALTVLGSPAPEGARAMLAALEHDNRVLAGRLGALHQIADAAGEAATCGFVETLIDAAEVRIWMLGECQRPETAA